MERKTIKIVHNLKKDIRKKLPPPNPEWPVLIIDATNFTNKNLFKQRLDVSTIKKACYCSDNNFSSKFGCYHGITPKKYINKHRVCAAKKIMRRVEDLRLTIIAFHIGYSSQSVLSNAFKRFENMTPSKWKKYRNFKRRNKSKILD